MISKELNKNECVGDTTCVGTEINCYNFVACPNVMVFQNIDEDSARASWGWPI